MQTFKGLAATLAVLSTIAVLGLLLAACHSMSHAANERSTAPMPTATLVHTTGIPALDLAAPTSTETATFALG